MWTRPQALTRTAIACSLAPSRRSICTLSITQRLQCNCGNAAASKKAQLSCNLRCGSLHAQRAAQASVRLHVPAEGCALLSSQAPWLRSSTTTAMRVTQYMLDTASGLTCGMLHVCQSRAYARSQRQASQLLQRLACAPSSSCISCCATLDLPACLDPYAYMTCAALDGNRMCNAQLRMQAALSCSDLTAMAWYVQNMLAAP